MELIHSDHCFGSGPAALSSRRLEVFFPVDADDAEALLARAFPGPVLYGLERMMWDADGVDDDAVWVAARLTDAAAAQHEDAGPYQGYREFTFPREVLNTHQWRLVRDDEVLAARRAEAAVADAFRARQRRP